MRDKLTQSDIDKMQQEIDYRQTTLRNKLIPALQEARAQGDLSENFEYYAAKRENRLNESRINYLEKMIRTAEIIEDDSAEDEVGINSLVLVQFEETGKEEVFKLSTTIKSQPLEKRISIDSPFGLAIKGKKVGDRVYVQVREDFGYYITILSIDKNGDDDDPINSY